MHTFNAQNPLTVLNQTRNLIAEHGDRVMVHMTASELISLILDARIEGVLGCLSIIDDVAAKAFIDPNEPVGPASVALLAAVTSIQDIEFKQFQSITDDFLSNGGRFKTETITNLLSEAEEEDELEAEVEEALSSLGLSKDASFDDFIAAITKGA